MTMPERLIEDVVRRAAVSILETGRELDEWDQAPFITLVARRGDDPVCIPVTIPESTWLEAHPADVLTGLTFGVSKGLLKFQLGEPITTADVCGVILFTEGHGVDSDELTPAQQVTLDDFQKRHRLEHHPKARELRMANIIDRSLTQAMIRHFRGSPVDDKVIYHITGRIPLTLERFVTALFASWIGAEAEAN